ncbi:nucleoside phosphatase GDA1/CD39, partial [Tilletiaria anomala UBC 951]
MTPPGLDQSQAGPSDLSKYQPYPDQAQRRGGDKGFASPELSSSFSTRSTDSEEEWQKDRRYAVVVDAGSSGSRMQVYSWKNPPVEKSLRETSSESTNVLPTVEKGTWDESKIDWQLKVEPGISTFGSHPEDLEPYLSKLFTYALSIIPTSEQSRTPVYMLATAGMRLLPSSQRNDILARTCSFIKERTPFDVGVDAEGCKKHVQVITGEEEGLLGWIAINYLMDGFQFREGPGATTPVTQKSTYGFLDMGGASTQIAFEPSAKALASTKQGQMAVDGLATVRLRMLDGTDVESNVFVTTFLGFGTNKARERYVEQLVHVNTQQTSTSGAAAESNAHTAALPDPCLPTGLVLPADSSPHVSVVGTGSFQACMAFLKPLLQREASCSHPPCLFDGVYVPPIDFSVNHFIGVSEYWYSTNDVFGLGGVYDWAGFQKAAIAYCSRPWEELKRDFDRGKWKGKNVDQNRLRMQCFKSAWMTTILHEGIGIPRINDRKGKGDGEDHAKAAQNLANDKNLFQSVNDIRGLSVSWTLGKAILEASRGIP